MLVLHFTEMEHFKISSSYFKRHSYTALYFPCLEPCSLYQSGFQFVSLGLQAVKYAGKWGYSHNPICNN